MADDDQDDSPARVVLGFAGDSSRLSLRRAAGCRAVWLDSLVGETLPVLAERDGTGYAPNYARVALPAGTAAGDIIEVNVREVREGLLG